jgi:hypothetical protein
MCFSKGSTLKIIWTLEGERRRKASPEKAYDTSVLPWVQEKAQGMEGEIF